MCFGAKAFPSWTGRSLLAGVDERAFEFARGCLGLEVQIYRFGESFDVLNEYLQFWGSLGRFIRGGPLEDVRALLAF